MMRMLGNIRKRLECFALEHRHPVKGLKAIRKLHKEMVKTRGIDRGSLSVANEANWKSRIYSMLIAYPELYEVAEAFFCDRLEIIKKCNSDTDDPICVVVEKNDLVRLRAGIESHRRLGIKRFVIIDNASSDGTLEWLISQEDVDVVTVSVPYSTDRREAWVNRVVAHYGESRWYLVVDSDEILGYSGCEERSIDMVVKKLENDGQCRARALMVDMYAQSDFYTQGRREDFLDECVYFDSDTYRKEPRRHLDLICGGPRERLFKQSPWLTKYPLFTLGKRGVECKSHFLFPLFANTGTTCLLFLRHYKFLPGDLEEYKNRVSNGSYYNGSSQYKRYVEVLDKDNALDFVYQGTTRYVNSRSFDALMNL